LHFPSPSRPQEAAAAAAADADTADADAADACSVCVRVQSSAPRDRGTMGSGLPFAPKQLAVGWGPSKEVSAVQDGFQGPCQAAEHGATGRPQHSTPGGRANKGLGASCCLQVRESNDAV